MTPELFREAGAAIYGADWRAHLAARSGINIRNIRRMAKGETKIGRELSSMITTLLGVTADLYPRRQEAIYDLLRRIADDTP